VNSENFQTVAASLIPTQMVFQVYFCANCDEFFSSSQYSIQIINDYIFEILVEFGEYSNRGGILNAHKHGVSIQFWISTSFQKILISAVNSLF
jgi:hypothetical protein